MQLQVNLKSSMNLLDIGVLSKTSGLPTSTLRYYDKQGLFPHMERVSGIRKFSDTEIEALRVIECLKKAGMEIKDIKQFMDWCVEGPSTYPQRRAMFKAQRTHVEAEIERMNRTLQDRLVKELRLSGIDSMEAGNAFLPDFMEDYNARFAVTPARSDDLHRPLNLAPDRLPEILCKREQRYVGSQLTFSFERKRIMLEETEVTRGLVGRYVETYAYADGRLDVRWKGYSLPYQVFDKEQRVTHAAITENKRLGDVLAYIKELQDQKPSSKVKSNSEKIGYKPRGRKPGRSKDFTLDPAVVARREKALSRVDAAE